MTNSVLLGAAPQIVSWLTPIFLLGAGAFLGLLLLSAILGAGLGLSRIPFFGELSETPKSRNLVAGAIAGVVTLIGASGSISRNYEMWADEGTSSILFGSFFSLAMFLAIGLLLGYTFIALVSRRAMDELGTTLAEGPVLWIICVAGAVSLLGGGAAIVVQDPQGIFRSLGELPYTGTEKLTYTIDAPEADSDDVAASTEQTIKVSFDGRLLKSLFFETDESMDVFATPLDEREFDKAGSINIQGDANERMVWHKSRDDTSIVPNEHVKELYVQNLSTSQTQLTLSVVTAPEYPQVITIPITAVAIVVVVLLYMLQRSLVPKLSAIALSTCKSGMSERWFIVFLVLIGAMLVVSVYVPYNTFGEDIKMLKLVGLQIILITAIFLAVWAASKSISEEVEGRTALTVLSKPLARRDFIIGKFVGITWSLAVFFIILSVVFLVVLSYKPIYDEYESGGNIVGWEVCHSEMTLIVPGLALAFMEVVVMTALSVAFSTRLPMMANFMTCAMVYVLGHLTPMMVQSSLNRFEIVTFVARLIATIFPVLDHFNIQAAVAGGAVVPMEYLGWSLVYCLIYGTIAMLLALVMFEDRDLA